MPVSSGYAPNSSTGNGVTTVFPYNFRILAAADLEVSVDGVVKTLTTDYSVSGVGAGSGGNVTFVAAPANGTTVIRRRNMALVRTTDYQDNGDLLADVLNPDQDAPVLMIQQLQEQVSRSFKVPLGDSGGVTLPAASGRAGKALVFDNSGNAAVSDNNFAALAAAAGASAAAAAGSAGAASSSAALAASLEAQAAAIVLGNFLQSGTGAVARTFPEKDRERVSVLDFMTTAQKSDVTSGTASLDVTAAIQACIDYVMLQGGLRRVYMPAGRYRTTSTIHAGYGASFQSVVIEGDGYAYRGQSIFNGTTIVADFNDRPAVNFQGARGSVLRGVAILGKNFNWITTHDLAGAAPTLDDTVAANWIDSSFPAASSSRYAPYAGVTIDAFSGVAPATPYPGGTYGRNFSSDVLIENCWIGGFVVAVANQPCDADGNGDFTKIRRCYLEANAYAVSVGNTQSRNVGMEGCTVAYFHSALVNAKHGKQLGKFGGVIDNCSFFIGTQLFDLPAASYAGPLVFNNCYAESLWKLGLYGANGVTYANASLTFIGGQFLFTNQTDARGVPAKILDAGAPTLVTFDGTHFEQFPSVAVFGGQVADLEFRNVKMRHASDTRTNPYEKLAHNFLAGGAMFQLAGGTMRPSKFSANPVYRYGIDSGSLSSEKIGPVIRSMRDFPICAWSNQAAGFNQTDYVVNCPVPWASLNKSSTSTVSLVGKTLTFTITAGYWDESFFAKSGPYPGDVIFDDDSNSVFFVRSVNVGTKVVIAELQNNYKFTGGVYVPVTAFSTSAGNFYFGNSRIYLPTYFLRADVSTASAVLSNAGRDDGYGGFIDTEVLVGDWLYVDDLANKFFSPALAKVTARSGAGNTITLSGNAARTLTVKPLGFFIRQPPANV